jgi:hypothetical protein
MTVSPLPTAGDWYFRNFPNGPKHDPRCLAVLASWQALYNLPITGRRRNKDGGFRAVNSLSGTGVEVHLMPGASFSTYDDSSLTILVIAAHRYRCRVDISQRRGVTCVMVTPRSDSGPFYEYHPGLADLAERIEKLVTK